MKVLLYGLLGEYLNESFLCFYVIKMIFYKQDLDVGLLYLILIKRYII